MSKYKMICLDIDGTLLNSEHKITLETKEAIQIAAKEKKIPVILVSARMPKGISYISEELNITDPIICYSGALIMDGKTKILTDLTIPISEVKQVFKLAGDMGISMNLYKDDEWYAEQIDEWVKQESEITNIFPVIMSFNDLFDLWEKENTGPNKVLCMAESKDIESFNARIKTYNLNNLNIYLSKPAYLEIMSSNSSKTSAIEVLCKMYGIQRSEIIAVGDNFNDINMIEFAGLGIAMNNALDAVKQYADDITLSNDKNGVAKVIEKYIL